MRKNCSILILIIALLLTACGLGGSGAGQPGNGGAEGQAPWQDEHFSLNHHYDGAYARDGIIYGYYSEGNGTVVVSQNASSGEVLSETVLPDTAALSLITADAQGNIYISDDESFWRINENGEIIAFEGFELEDSEEAINVRPIGIYIDREGCFYLHYRMSLPSTVFDENAEANVYSVTDRIYIKDRQLNSMFYEQFRNADGSRLVAFYLNESGKPTVMEQGKISVSISEMDIENRKLTSQRELPGLGFSDGDRAMLSDQGIIFTSGNALYQYEEKEQSRRWLTDFISCGVFQDNVLYMGMNGDKLEIVDNYDREKASEYVVISEGESRKTVVTLGVLIQEQSLEQAVVEFNRFNREAKIELVNYGASGDLNIGLEQLKLDVITGKAPDIIDVTGIDARIFTNKGVFADLYDLMDKDEEFDRDMLLESVRKAYETNGHLFSIGARFNVHSMWGLEEIFKGKSGITMNELTQTLESMGSTVNAIYGIPSDVPVLTTISSFALDQFIDWEKGECDFTNEYMKELLDFAAQYERGQQGGRRDYVLRIGFINSVSDYQFQKMLFGGEITFVGYPTERGTGTALTIISSELAINAAGEHQELAWEFVKCYLQNGKAGMGFPTWKENFDAYMQDAMTDDYKETDSLSDDSKIPAPKTTYSYGGELFSVYAASQEEVDTLTRLIEGVDTRYHSCVEIQNILNEEAEAYLQGQKDFEAVSDIIQRKVSIFLSEQME